MKLKKIYIFFKAEASLYVLAVYIFIQKHSGDRELFVNMIKINGLNI